jgi:hypothetical protein
MRRQQALCARFACSFQLANPIQHPDCLHVLKQFLVVSDLLLVCVCSWVEVWDGKYWSFMGSAEFDARGFNRTW